MLIYRDGNARLMCDTCYRLRPGAMTPGEVEALSISKTHFCDTECERRYEPAAYRKMLVTA